MANAFYSGVVLAFGLILPLGMQNIFVFNQGATQPRYRRVVPSVVTAFLCDMILILCAVSGVSLIVNQFVWLRELLFIGGVIFLCSMGYIGWKQSNQLMVVQEPLSIKKQIGFTASVSLLNPHALFDSVAVIGTNSLHFLGYDKWIYTIACISVSFCWFFGLSLAGYYLKKFDTTGLYFNIMNKISAITMWIIACYLFQEIL